MRRVRLAINAVRRFLARSGRFVIKNYKLILLALLLGLLAAGAVNWAVRWYVSDPDRIISRYSDAESNLDDIRMRLLAMQEFSIEPGRSLQERQAALDGLLQTIEENRTDTPSSFGLSIFLEDGPDKRFELERLEDDDPEAVLRDMNRFISDYKRVLDAVEPVLAYSTDELQRAAQADQNLTAQLTNTANLMESAHSAFNGTVDSTENPSAEYLVEIEQVLQRMSDAAGQLPANGDIERWQRLSLDYRIEIATQLNRRWSDFRTDGIRQLDDTVADYQRVQTQVRQRR